MAKDNQTIVVKRVKKGGHGHHGGAWKIAFADFMTAMFAFFLVMWLLAVSSEQQRAGVAEYFSMPLSSVLGGGSKSGSSPSVIPGGGPQPIFVEGEEMQGAEGMDRPDSLEVMKENLDALADTSPVLKAYRDQIVIDLTPQGLRLQIIDKENRPMFDLASAEVKPYMKAILREIGPKLNELPNKIALSGHTDAHHYARGDKVYGNWELSAERANASRRELVAGGMDEHKVLRVVAMADSMNFHKTDPFNPANRRISIILLNKSTQEQIERENTSNDTSTRASLVPDSPRAATGSKPVPATNR